MSGEAELSTAQRTALSTLGITAAQFDAFLRGELVVYEFAIGGQPAVAMAQRQGSRFRSGIVEINDPGGGILTFGAFAWRSLAVARAFESGEIEFFGMAVVNPQLADVLLQHGFEPSIESVPEVLGGGTAEILSRVYRLA